MENDQIQRCREFVHREFVRSHHVGDRAVLYARIIEEMAQKNDQCRLTNQELSESIDFLSTSRVADFIDELVTDGWLKREITETGDRVLSLVPVDHNPK